MTNPGLEVLLYALLAALSALALAAVLVVLRSGRGRVNGSAFAIGFLAGQAAIYLLAFAVGVASVQERSAGYPTFQSVLELALGITMIVVAARMRARPAPAPRESGPRTRALMRRLERLRAPEALGAGAVLGVGGPKRLLITVLAAATVSTAGLHADAKLALSVGYVVIATVLVWVPVVLYVVLGERAAVWMTDVGEWLTAHRRQLTVPMLVVVGLFFVVDAVVRLV